MAVHHHDLENPDRGNTAGVSGNNVPNPDVDAANPRYWLGQQRRVITERHRHCSPARQRQRAHRAHQGNGDNAGAETFVWDIFLFAQAKADSGLDDANYQQNVNLSGLSEFNDLSAGRLLVLKASGILWIETDDNTFTDVTNAMLLAAVPGVHGGDGGKITVVNKADGSPNRTVTDKTCRDLHGQKMTDVTFKRF
jgi:secreted PhoX family phosphatase